MPSRQRGRDAERIRIPADLNDRFDRFLSSLKLRILEQAIQRAASRTGGDAMGTLQTDDLLAAAPQALADAAIGLNDARSPSESVHVRRAS